VSEPLRVLIADDHPPTRAGVRMALEHGAIEVCAEVGNAADAVAAAEREVPDACLLDIEMPGSGIWAAAEITTFLPDVPVLMLTVSRNTDDLFDALRAGAVGYLLKDMDPAELPAAVRSAVAGEAALSGVLAARLIEEFRRRGGRTTVAVAGGQSIELTRREWDVLELLTDGLTTAEIAGRLFLSQVTVRRHVSAVLRKLHVKSREEARSVLAKRRPPPPRRRSAD
jgi:DNA-binding NarL/FixJ family response regulator